MAAGFVFGSQYIELLVPLRFREGGYGDVQVTFQAVALDQRTMRFETFGDGAEQAEGTIRFAGDPDLLRAMLRDGAGGTVLNYYPDLATSTFYPVVLMNHGTVVLIKPDRDRFGYGEWEVIVILRRVDGGSLATMVQGA